MFRWRLRAGSLVDSPSSNFGCMTATAAQSLFLFPADPHGIGFGPVTAWHGMIRRQWVLVHGITLLVLLRKPSQSVISIHFPNFACHATELNASNPGREPAILRIVDSKASAKSRNEAIHQPGGGCIFRQVERIKMRDERIKMRKSRCKALTLRLCRVLSCRGCTSLFLDHVHVL